MSSWHDDWFSLAKDQQTWRGNSGGSREILALESTEDFVDIFHLLLFELSIKLKLTTSTTFDNPSPFIILFFFVHSIHLQIIFSFEFLRGWCDEFAGFSTLTMCGMKSIVDKLLPSCTLWKSKIITRFITSVFE